MSGRAFRQAQDKLKSRPFFKIYISTSLDVTSIVVTSVNMWVIEKLQRINNISLSFDVIKHIQKMIKFVNNFNLSRSCIQKK